MVDRPGRTADEIFIDALGRPPEDRDRFLRDACDGDDLLRADIESLLAAHAEAGGFLETPPVDAGLRDWAPDSGGLAGGRIGAYRLVRRIGIGGMSTVWLGERADPEFEMSAAVKLIAPGPDADDIQRRFRTERQVLAGLEHPNIARLLDGGITDDGQPYLIMEYVDGLPIDEYCAKGTLSVDARLALFRTVCSAVQYAHRHLVVHRDLKPSNILVDGDGRVKLLDFGIAKVLDPEPVVTDLTRTAARAMTPRYASPEQIRGEPITTATDVYSLGIVLYELLTGESPYRTESRTPAELERLVCETEPTRPSVAVTSGTADGIRDEKRRRLSHRLAGDLDNILLMSMRKEPDRRYESAERFAEDLRRHVQGLPVLARPDTIRYRTGKFVRRNLVPVVAGSIAVLVLIVATLVSTSLFLEARRARDVAERAQARSESEQERAEQIANFLREMLASIDPDRAQGRDTELLREVLENSAARLDAELGDRPDLAWGLHETIGSTYLGLGENQAAERHQRRAVELIESKAVTRADGGFGEREIRDLALAYAGLTDALGELGRHEESESLLRKALDMPFGPGPADRAARASLLANLAVCLDRIGGTDESEQCFREVVEIRRDVLGPDHWELAASLADLGRYLTVHDKRKEAEPFLIEGLELSRRHIEEKPLLAAGSMLNLGDWYRWEGRYEEAEPLFREALELHRRLLDRDHPMRANALSRFASLLEYLRKFEEAEPAYREALAIQRRTHGNDHREVGTTLNNLAGLLRKVGRYQEALQLFEEAARIYGRELGSDHAWVAIVKTNEARVYELMGDGVEAERAAREALAIGRGHWPKDHVRMAVASSILGSALAMQGRTLEADPILHESLGFLEASLDADDRRVLDARARLALR